MQSSFVDQFKTFHWKDLTQKNDLYIYKSDIAAFFIFYL